MSKNNFKDLENLNIENRVDNQNITKNILNSNIHFFGLISSIIDLYLPKIGRVIVSALNDSSPNIHKDRKPGKYPNK